ncbi:VWD domain-containing protein [Vampirovibrio sp.]|uniref:VWD domain-containing protein n=1 Tax=Vampirovibrio sp. TaxID=2717857 RepID=UPI003593EAF2
MTAIKPTPYAALAQAKTSANALRYPHPPEKKPVAANETAFIWGDPHIAGADGDRFDVNKVGKFNLLEDKGVKFNADFRKFTDKSAATIIRATDLEVDGKKIKIDVNAKVTIDGKELQSNTYKAWGGDNQISKLRNGNVLIDTGEYTILVASEGSAKNKFLNASVSSGKHGVSADGVAPKGLLGETFDADAVKQTKPKKNLESYQVGVKPAAPKPSTPKPTTPTTPKPTTPKPTTPKPSTPKPATPDIKSWFDQFVALLKQLFGNFGK